MFAMEPTAYYERDLNVRSIYWLAQYYDRTYVSPDVQSVKSNRDFKL